VVGQRVRSPMETKDGNVTRKCHNNDQRFPVNYTEMVVDVNTKEEKVVEEPPKPLSSSVICPSK
jgi:hypothetical protein